MKSTKKMADGGAVLAKMIATSRASSEVPNAAALAALNISTGKVGRALFDVETTIEETTCTMRTRDELLESAPTPGLLVVVNCGNGSTGLLSLDALLINALVELATGAAENSVCLDQRVPTLIDAALCREFSQQLLEAYVRELEYVVGYSALPDLSYVSHETDVARLVYQLEDTVFRQISAKVSFQADTRGGKLSLCLPKAIWRNKKKKGALTTSEGWRQQLTLNVLGAPLLLKANLDVVMLSLSAALSLKPSDIMPVSPGALSSIDLVSDRGITLLTGRLGQINGKKAVCTSGEYTDGANAIPANPPQNQLPPAITPDIEPQPNLGDPATGINLDTETFATGMDPV